MIKNLINPLRYAYRWLRNTFKIYDPEDKIIAESQQYWNDPSRQELQQFTHNRGAGVFKDEEKWLSIGRRSLDIFQELAKAVPQSQPLTNILEWGCGGGANALSFAPLAQTFYGLDISKDALKECASQLEREGIRNYRMVEINATDPEKALQDIQVPIDLFFCIHVMEVFPSKNYTERILAITSKLLRTGGMAFLQYKYTTPSWDTQPKRWSYSSDPPNMTTYWIDEFWQVCEKHGLVPQVMKLVPPRNQQDTGRRYAYVLCVKK
jgi:cyclopropane fatty-acyl-phospholipid synthase-like methyltransferase